MADYQYRGSRGNYRSGRISKRSNRGRSYGSPSYQHPGAFIASSRLRLDQDVQMNGQGFNQRPSNQSRQFDPVRGGGGGGSRFRKDNRNDRTRRRPQVDHNVLQRLGLPTGSRVSQNSRPSDMTDWYKITIPKGKNFGRDFILTSILSLTEVKFEPVNFHEVGMSAVFFVRGRKVALAIADTSDRVTLPDSSKMIIKTERLQSRPSTVMTAEVVEKLKLCMNKRYDVPSSTLNMSNLFNDEDMRKEELYLDLNHTSVVDRVLSIIAEYIPELKSINLNANQLCGLKQFATIAQKAPQLNSLILTNNKLRSERELQSIDKLPLEELSLDGNPLCNNFTDKQSYVSAIRKLFPKVIRLDGHVLPPPITFDVDTPTTLPSQVGSYFLNDQYKNLICRFINCYYVIYDGDNRQPIMEAYHPEAMFSLSVYNSRQINRSGNWNDYQSNDRNLKSIRDSNKRQTHLKKGRLEVVSLLDKLPLTQHCPDSMIVDVNAASSTMLVFTIHGVFKERASKLHLKPIRKFSRTFVTVPSTADPGLSIINEMFNITVAGSSAEKYFTAVQPAPVPAPITNPVGANDPSDVQMMMVQQFSTESGMNRAWSTKCLSENNWDYNKAAAVFVEVKAKQGIPPEAFIQS